MAHKKGQGSSRNGRDSGPKFRGVKVFGGEQIKAGGIIIRQVGTVVHPGENVGIGRDYTIYALVHGTVLFSRRGKNKSRVSVVPAVEAASAPSAPSA